MSKLVCNVAKFKGGQLYGMDIHIQRKTDNHSNKDIDLNRSDLNYELVSGYQNEHYFTAVNNRIKQGYLGQKSLRKDATLACGVLISSDKKFFEGLTEEQEREFFKTAYDHLCDVYGKENIISAKVHKDETTPHLHAIVVPLTKDGRLTAKELFNRKALTALHNEIPKKLKQRGFNIARGEENAKVKRMETAEFKRIREQNKISISINPADAKPIIKAEGFFKKETETPDEIAYRLTQKYVKPLTEEIADLRTELAVNNAQEQKIKSAKLFSKNREDEFTDLYKLVREFGSNYVDDVLLKVRSFINKLNTQKRQQDEIAEKKRAEELEDQRRKNIARLHGNDPDLAIVISCGKAPYKMQEDGKPSYYALVTNLLTKIDRDFWGFEYKELGLKNGNIVRVIGDKIEKIQRIEEPKIKKTSGMKM